MSPAGFQPSDLLAVLPSILVAVAGVVALLSQAFSRKGQTAPAASIAFIGLAGALLATVRLASSDQRPMLGTSVVADDFALFFHVLILGVGLLAVLLSPAYLRATGCNRGEYYALLLFAVVGMLGLVQCRELVALFVALEIMSVALYALSGMHRDRPESQEAALKYFVTGAFSSAFLLYGVALLYGLSGSTSLPEIAAAVAKRGETGETALALLAVGLLLVGFGFKVASVPFHMWTPDVYEGAPTTVTALMAAGVKAAAFGALLRVFGQALGDLAPDWRPAVASLAILTMILGNLGALAQSNLKRLLAYSSVAHAGYLLVAVVASPGAGTSSALFYLVAYAAVNLGAFGALASLARGDGREPLALSDLAGLGDRRPALAAALTVFLVSLMGVPVSAGFVGKFQMFSAAVGAGYVNLAIVGVLMSVVSAFYYLRIVVYMYMHEPLGEDTWAPVPAGAAVALTISVALTLGLGVYPAPILAWARAAATSLAL